MSYFSAVSRLVAGCLFAVAAGLPAMASDEATDKQVVLPAAVIVEATKITDADQPATCQDKATCRDASGDATCELAGEAAGDEAQIAVVSVELPAEEVGEEEADESAPANLGQATHQQIATIEVNSSDRPKVSLHSFCLSADGIVLAACSGGDSPGEIRRFDAEGNYLDAWQLPVSPEAINRGSDGMIYIAGGGHLLKLDAEGKVQLDTEAPHVAALKSDREALREQVIAQHGEYRELYQQQIEMYKKMIEKIEKKEAAEKAATEGDAEKATEQATGEATEEAEETDPMAAFLGQMSKEQLQQTLEAYEEAIKQYGPEELTEEDIEKQIDAAISSKTAVASISEASGTVFIATNQPVGYGFSVWRMNTNFEECESIVDGLSGCCGQMDVQACESGVYVAENSRKRVVRFDHQGEKITSWGKSARSGLRGFGSCCNPMNVAFGPEGTVYTAESEMGRIKRYDENGKLLGLVGKVDLVPGCKKVAICVNNDGSRVYMLDISRHTILVMQQLAEGEVASYSESDGGEGGSVFGALIKAFGLGD